MKKLIPQISVLSRNLLVPLMWQVSECIETYVLKTLKQQK